MGEVVYIDIITFFIKTLVMNFCMYYSFHKIIHIKSRIINFTIFSVLNLIISVAYTYAEYKINSIFSLLIVYLLFVVLLSIITKQKAGYSLIVCLIAYAICNVALLFSVLINFILYHFLYRGVYWLNLISIVAVEAGLVYAFFKIKKFSRGLGFLNEKLNNDTTDVIVSFLSVVVTIIAAFIGTLYEISKVTTYNVLVTFILLGITMFIMIQRTLTMHYKQRQMLKTLKEYEAEIKEQEKQIEKLNEEKFNTSKIRHEFYHRQKALEMMVASQYSKDAVLENTNTNVLDIINKLTQEYSLECEKIKQLDELDKTNIPEIDSMFKYMHNECAKAGIEFKLRIIGDIYSLINNIIPKSRLETLIGDHIKDAINAVNAEGIERKEILVILGVNNGCYELIIYDSGNEFEIDTLLKLGIEATTTCKNIGGSGIGFITTFETLKETNASLIITELHNTDNSYYTKSVTIRFDNKQNYIIRSYRADEIRNNNIDNREIIIEANENI